MVSKTLRVFGMRALVAILLGAVLLPTLISANSNSRYPKSFVPLRIAIVGLVHPHAEALFDILKRSDVEVVGVNETVQEVVDQYIKKGLDQRLLYKDEAEM